MPDEDCPNANAAATIPNVKAEQPQQNVPGQQPNDPQQLSAEDSALVIDLTNRLMAQASEEEKNDMRASLKAPMDPQQWAKYEAQGLDPLYLYYRNQAMHRLRQEKQSRIAQAQAQPQQLAQQTNIPSRAPIQQRGAIYPTSLNARVLIMSLLIYLLLTLSEGEYTIARQG